MLTHGGGGFGDGGGHLFWRMGFSPVQGPGLNDGRMGLAKRMVRTRSKKAEARGKKEEARREKAGAMRALRGEVNGDGVQSSLRDLANGHGWRAHR